MAALGFAQVSLQNRAAPSASGRRKVEKFAISVDQRSCIQCPKPEEQVSAVLLATTIAAAALLIFFRFAWWVMANEDKAKRHVMTVMIIINHASNLALISSMRFQWPAFVKELSKVMRLDFLVFLQPECLITDHGSPWFWLWHILNASWCF